MRWVINAGLPREDPDPEPDDREPVSTPAQVRRMVRQLGWGEDFADYWAAHVAGIHDHERVSQPRYTRRELERLMFLRWMADRGRIAHVPAVEDECVGV